MTELSDSELRRLDLTLLLVLLGLLRRRRAAIVARDLGLTPSAVSQALGRLRDLFGDPLFLRRPHGLEPTALAIGLEAPVAAAVETLRGALGTARAFNPATADGIVRIAALDAEQAVLIPPLAQRLMQAAPGLRVIALPLARAAALVALEEARADLALGFIAERPASIPAATLYAESFAVVGRPDALPQAPTLSLDTYLGSEHVLVSPGGDLRGVVDTALAELGLSRRVILALPAFLPALAAVAETGAVATIPARLAARYAPGFGLAVATPPLALRPFDVAVFWHRRDDADARSRWLRRLLAEIATATGPSDAAQR